MRSFISAYRGKDGAEISLGYKSFRVITAHRQIPEQERVACIRANKNNVIIEHNRIAQYQYVGAWFTVEDFLAHPTIPAESFDGLSLIPFYNIVNYSNRPSN
jgi:hypothetical protein